MRKYFVIRLLDSISLGKEAATALSDNCLDYVPGSAIMGIVASAMYNSKHLENTEIDKLIQTGAVLFSNCYPMKVEQDQNGELFGYESKPLAMSFHKPKVPSDWNNDNSPLVKEAFTNAIYINKCVKSPLSDEALRQESLIQYRQVRTGYAISEVPSNSCNNLVKVSKYGKTSTAVDHKTQIAKESQLFSTNYIEKDQYFCGYIDSEDQVFLDKAQEILESDNVRIGSRRNTEFGRISIKFISDERKNNQPQNLKNDLYLWCLSDVEFYDTEQGTGQSSVPIFSNLWVEDLSKKGKYDSEKSFIRNRRVRMFNRKRGGFDSERILVEKGSVIHFSLDTPLLDNELALIEEKGIGLGRNFGFGQVSVNPEWINSYIIKNDKKLFSSDFNKISISKLFDIRNSNSYEKENNSDNWILWIKSMKSNVLDDKSRAKVAELDKELANLYINGRTANGIDDFDPFGPSSSQINDISTLLKDSKNDFAIFKDKLSESITNKSDLGEWNRIIGNDNKKPLYFKFAYKEILMSTEDCMILHKHFENIKASRPDLSMQNAKKLRKNAIADYKMITGDKTNE